MLRSELKYYHEGKICRTYRCSEMDVSEKHNAAAPYYFFLTSIMDSRETHTDQLSLQFSDILNHSLGDLESSLQINSVVEFDWLIAQYHVANQRGKPITILYEEIDIKNLDVEFVTAVNVKSPSHLVSHNTKMCVLAYKDGSVRVCVHTGNLVGSDWENCVQGVWLSPLCPVLPVDASSDAGGSYTHFKRDLIEYLSAYRLPELQPWIEKLYRADFSNINVFFVASSPGSYKGMDMYKWGLMKLGSLLSQHVRVKWKWGHPPSNWQIIAQCSSIGNLGPYPTSWFCGEVKHAMSQGLNLAVRNEPSMRLVYPSFENVTASHDGLLGGGCLPYSKETHHKQAWLQQYLYRWKCTSRHRTKAMPQIKTYTCVSEDVSEMLWFHLTSANLSKAAWGSKTETGAFCISSYEAGVLFLPKFVIRSSSFSIKKRIATSLGLPVFPMPYDLPLSQYNPKAVPWFIENLS